MVVEAAPALGRKPTVEFKNDATRCKIYASPHQKKHDLSLVKEPVGAWTYSGVYNDDESMSTAYTDLPVHWSKPVVTEHNVSTACLIYDSNRNRSSVDVRETHSPSGRLHDNDAREAPSTTRSSQSSISTLRRKLRGQGALTSNSTGSFDDDDTISAARDSASTSGSSTPPRSLADKYMVMAEDIAACEMSSDYDSTRMATHEPNVGGCNANTNLVSLLRLSDLYSIVDGDANVDDACGGECSNKDWSSDFSHDKQVSLDKVKEMEMKKEEELKKEEENKEKKEEDTSHSFLHRARLFALRAWK